MYEVSRPVIHGLLISFQGNRIVLAMYTFSYSSEVLVGSVELISHASYDLGAVRRV